ncbi:TraB/GumN family protein [Geotalea sp. SG265]|uniref:TraB/GumN family protein n=1 Tax=Geotalea sp. SG265 TaxID=2922867 RepID=UPI001FAF4EE6|nr:TraB/GumN family protein [Geotalea sp. SG265]
MKRLILGILLCFSVCTGAFAESSVWKAQKRGSTIYLGGTCHILRESDYPLPTEFEKAYNASDLLVFETDIAGLLEPAVQQKLLAKALYTDGSTLDKHLSSPVYGELSAFCQADGIPLQALSRFKPSMVMVTLTVLELKKKGATEQGVDQYFYGQAVKDKKPVEGLEIVDEQIEFLTTMADGNEDDFVRHSLSDMKTMEGQLGSLADAWRTGDVKKLDELMVADIKSRQPKLYKKLITDRNLNWLPLIDAYGKTPKTEFILVGVGHLVGPDGIIEALKKKGYKVEKL